ncbi:TPA: hypothetical protein I7258_14535 [Vibrio parahaemolyticus]|nr:hypothetical protein [Vibrio parahaemolyticus]
MTSNGNRRKEKSDPIGSPSRSGKASSISWQLNQEAINYTGSNVSNVSNVVSKRIRASSWINVSSPSQHQLINFC